MVSFLEPVVFRIQGHPPHHRDPIPAKIANAPDVLLVVSNFLATCSHRDPPMASGREHSRPGSEAPEVHRARRCVRGRPTAPVCGVGVAATRRGCLPRFRARRRAIQAVDNVERPASRRLLPIVHRFDAPWRLPRVQDPRAPGRSDPRPRSGFPCGDRVVDSPACTAQIAMIAKRHPGRNLRIEEG